MHPQAIIKVHCQFVYSTVRAVPRIQQFPRKTKAKPSFSRDINKIDQRADLPKSEMSNKLKNIGQCTHRQQQATTGNNKVLQSYRYEQGTIL